MSDRGIWTSASNAQADSLCAARHRLQQGYPEKEGVYSEFGRRVHEALAGRIPEDKLTTEEFGAYEKCRSAESEALSIYFGGSSGYVIQREQRLWIDLGKFKHSGQFDMAARLGTRALIGDYKSLWADTPQATVNRQLRDLAVLYWHNNLALEEVGVFVAQPGHRPDICVYLSGEIERSMFDLATRVANSNDPNSEPVAGEVQCKFCRAKADCPAHRAWAGPVTLLPVERLGPDVRLWTPSEWDLFLSRRAAAKKLIEEIEDYAKVLLEKDPNAIPGWRLKPGTPRHPIKDVQKVYERFDRLGGSLADFMACVTVTKKTLAEKVRAITGYKGGALDSAVDLLTDGTTETTNVAPSIEKTKT